MVSAADATPTPLGETIGALIEALVSDAVSQGRWEAARASAAAGTGKDVDGSASVARLACAPGAVRNAEDAGVSPTDEPVAIGGTARTTGSNQCGRRRGSKGVRTRSHAHISGLAAAREQGWRRRSPLNYRSAAPHIANTEAPGGVQKLSKHQRFRHFSRLRILPQRTILEAHDA